MRPLRDLAEFSEFIASFTNYERMASYRYDPETLGIERMRSFAREIGNPQDAYPAAHIAGSKGKGTTTLFLEALLAAHGLAIGAYTSPHLESMEERIRTDGASITPERLLARVNEILPVLARRERSPGEMPTYFELMTALAMLEFRHRAVDVAIFEVGLGGRLDATNILRSRWTAITSIGLEHTALLGDSLGEIAREKAGIVKPEVPLVLGPLADEAREMVLAIARDRRAEVHEIDPHSVRRVAPQTLRIEGLAAAIRAPNVRGPALRTDLAIAFALAELVLRDRSASLRRDRVEAALGGLRLPARAEFFTERVEPASAEHRAAGIGAPGNAPGRRLPPVCLDGAHTPESFDALARTLEEEDFPRPRTLVFSIARDKTLVPILDVLPRLADRVLLTRADPQRSYLPEELLSLLPNAELWSDPLEALRRADAIGDPIVIAGSIYLAGRLRRHLLATGSRTE